jgi:hypothetical protein
MLRAVATQNDVHVLTAEGVTVLEVQNLDTSASLVNCHEWQKLLALVDLEGQHKAGRDQPYEERE